MSKLVCYRNNEYNIFMVFMQNVKGSKCTFGVSSLQGFIPQIRVSVISLHLILLLVNLVETPVSQDLEQGDQAVV